MATCALCRRTYSQNREIQKSYTNNDSQPGAYSSKTNTNNHKNKQRKGQTLTKLHQQRQAMTYCVGAHTSKTKKIKKANAQKKQRQIQNKNKDKLRRCTYFQKKYIDKKTNTNTNDDKYKTEQRQIAQVHILPRENQQQSHEQAVNMAAAAAKVSIFRCASIS